ncbi:MAG: VCBS repeat-containing protein, partial [Nanoarchaeota archaeon]
MNGDGKQDILVSKIESQIVPPPSISSNLFAYTGPPYNGRTFIQSGADGSVIAELVNPALSSSQIMDFNFGHKVGSAGDVNGDGTKDLFVLGFRVESVQLNTYSQPTPNRIAKILLYSGIAPYSLIYSIDYNDLPATPTGSYATPLNSWVASFPSFLDLGDVNADGKADIAISFDSSPNNNVIHILSGANKAHIRSITFGTGGIMRHVAGDINNDGVNDILTALVAPSGSQYPNNIIIFSGVDGNILRQRAYPSSYSSINYLNDNIITAAVGDFNNDNYDDVLIFNEIRSGLDDSLLFTFNLPTTSSFSLAQLALSPDAGRRTAKEFMDVNGDGKFDFIFSSINSYFFAISGVDNSFIFNFVNTGSVIDYGLVKGGANVDSDPSTEFTLFNQQAGTFFVFNYAGVPTANLVLPPQNGRILTPDCIPSSTVLNSYYGQTRDFISLKDINNDGKEDYAITVYNPTANSAYGSSATNRLELYSGATRQLISTINSPSATLAIRDAVVAGVDGNGDKELVVSQLVYSYGGSGEVLVYDNI